MDGDETFDIRKTSIVVIMNITVAKSCCVQHALVDGSEIPTALRVSCGGGTSPLFSFSCASEQFEHGARVTASKARLA